MDVQSLLSTPSSTLLARPISLCFLYLLPYDVLQGDGVCGKLGDTFPQFLNSHGLIVEVEAEECFIVDVALLLKVQRTCIFRLQLLRDRLR